MKNWLPYLVAAVLGIGVAVVAFGPGTGAPPPSPSPEATDEKPGRKVVSYGEAGARVGDDGTESRTPEQVVSDARARELPEPGTLRPLNESEIAHKARLARPYNQRGAHVSSFWNRATQIVGTGDKALAAECSAMARYLRDQGNLNEELDAQAAITKELALVAKLRGVDPKNGELTLILDYLEASGNAILKGEDPLAVTKPTAADIAAAK